MSDPDQDAADAVDAADQKLYDDLRARFDAGEYTEADLEQLKTLDPEKYPYQLVDDDE